MPAVWGQRSKADGAPWEQGPWSEDGSLESEEESGGAFYMRLRRGEWRDGHGASFARGLRSGVKGLRQMVRHGSRDRGLEMVV